nr:MAG TPA: hypothetical protein [Bacteriophage sp.]
MIYKTNNDLSYRLHVKVNTYTTVSQRGWGVYAKIGFCLT